jgi:hypothetical protein
MKTFQLSPVADLRSIIADGELVAFNVGPDKCVYLVIALHPLDYRLERNGGASFPKTIPHQPQKYRIVALHDDQTILDLTVEQEQFNIHDIQPLGNDLLLTCARAQYRSPNDFEKNGRIYNRSGQFLCEILLGDGIQSVQTTSDGIIWTSFFDEGVFGNYGWSDPVGASGLVAWDSTGQKHWEYQPTGNLDNICDCYALNVASPLDTWCYYYTDFPLVHIHDRSIVADWEVPIEGSDGFAVASTNVLFRGGYDDHNTYHLFSLESKGRVEPIAEIQFQDIDGNRLIAQHISSRENMIYLICNEALYRIDLQAITDKW